MNSNQFGRMRSNADGPLGQPMIHIERSTDYALIKAVMSQPAIYRHISDDGSPPASEYSTDRV